MTNGREYRLADKMQNQFRNRGSEVSGMQASSTSELMRRAEMGRDPGVNCAEQAFRENYRNKQTQGSRRSYTAQQNRAQSYNAQTRGSTYSQYSGRQNVNRQNRTASGTAKRKTAEKHDEPVTPAVEIQVKHKAFPPMFIIMLIIGTFMVMCLVFSISEIYQTTNEIAQLENELEELQNEADELRLRLEEKNDVREIEEIATAQLGMVKEDSLQRRYVSISDGEYIELVADDTETEESTGGVMLSSIFTSLGKFFERFK